MPTATATFTVATVAGLASVEVGDVLPDGHPAVRSAPHLFTDTATPSKPSKRTKATQAEPSTDDTGSADQE